MLKVNVIGAGLAGVEATYQLVKRGIAVDLYEMRPEKSTAAHETGLFAELVCSNSLRSADPLVAVGLLKAEMKTLDSLVIKTAEATAVPAGSALAVDRELFAQSITDFLTKHPLVNIITKEVTTLPSGYTILCTGPLTSPSLADTLSNQFGDRQLSFYDAIAPIISKDSIDFSRAYYKSRYDKGSADYINCPFTQTEFQKFYQALIQAEQVTLKDFETKKFFEGCLPVEELAKRGERTLVFGPMKPVGLGIGENRPYAVVQLRQDNVADKLYNLVGFQTNLTYGAQKEVFRLIPGLGQAEFVRYGAMHRNTYLKAPALVNQYYQVIKQPELFIAGQLIGVEGYVESASSGLLAALNLSQILKQKPLPEYTNTSVITALAYYISHAASDNFQPMKANFGIVATPAGLNKQDKKAYFVQQSKDTITFLQENYDGSTI